MLRFLSNTHNKPTHSKIFVVSQCSLCKKGWELRTFSHYNSKTNFFRNMPEFICVQIIPSNGIGLCRVHSPTNALLFM